MKRIKLTDNNISPNQRRLRLMELGGIQITDKQKKRLEPRTCINEVVSMVEIPTNRLGIVPKEPIQEPDEEIDLEEILKEMGYGDTDDLRDDYTDEVGEDDTISNMSIEGLKQLIQSIVLDTMEEEDDLNEIIENITKNY